MGAEGAKKVGTKQPKSATTKKDTIVNKTKAGLARGGANSIKKLQKNKRQIFKPILSNPYTGRNKWPRLEPDTMRNIADVLVEQVLAPIGRYTKLTKNERAGLEEPNECKLVSHGFNSTMEALEKEIKRQRDGKIADSGSDVVAIFVVKPDVSATLMYMSFPVLSNLSRAKLVQLPKGTSQRIGEALGSARAVEFLVVRRQILEMYPTLSKLVSQVADVDVGFLDDKLGMDVKYLLVDQPTGKTGKR